MEFASDRALKPLSYDLLMVDNSRTGGGQNKGGFNGAKRRAVTALLERAHAEATRLRRHGQLRDCRTTGEWFACTAERAIDAVRNAIQSPRLAAASSDEMDTLDLAATRKTLGLTNRNGNAHGIDA
jgi:hypothetical protein